MSELNFNPAIFYLIIAAGLFLIGALGVMLRRNILVVFMCIELMLNAVNLTLVTFSNIHGNLDGQVFVLFIMAIAAAEAAVGLAIIVGLFRNFYSTTSENADLLRG